jgi:hypothetical protein
MLIVGGYRQAINHDDFHDSRARPLQRLVSPRTRSTLQEIPGPLEEVGSVDDKHHYSNNERETAPEHAPLPFKRDPLILQLRLQDGDLAALQLYELREQLVRALGHEFLKKWSRANAELSGERLLAMRYDGDWVTILPATQP